MATTLRKKPPFFCRNNVAGKLCLAVLTTQDDKLCGPCAKSRDEFFAKPVHAPSEPAGWVKYLEAYNAGTLPKTDSTARPIWPGQEA